MAYRKLDEIWYDDTEKTLWRRVKEGFEGLATKVASLIVSGKLKADNIEVGTYPVPFSPSTGDILITDGSTAYTKLSPNEKALTMYRATTNVDGNYINFYKSRGSIAPSNRAVIASGDDIGLIRSYAHDGTTDIEATRITFDTTGTIALNRVGGVIRFSARPDSTSDIAEVGNITFNGLTLHSGKTLTVNGIEFRTTYAAGDSIIGCMPSRIHTTSATSYTRATGTWVARRSGIVRVKFSVVRRASSGTGFGMVYRNGAAVSGTEISNTNAGVWSSGSFDISVNIGDTIEIWTRSSSVSLANGNIGNARICTNDIDIPVPLQVFAMEVSSTSSLALPPMDTGQTITGCILNAGSISCSILTPAATGTYLLQDTGTVGITPQGTPVVSLSTALPNFTITRIA